METAKGYKALVDNEGSLIYLCRPQKTIMILEAYVDGCTEHEDEVCFTSEAENVRIIPRKYEDEKG